ncbi:MAG: histidinol-phosphate transaminase [bacterium]|nr:histidinol-phosphate transaminase [bacterium]
MKEISRLVRPSVRELKAYHVSEPDVAVKLHANESPFNLSEKLRELVAREIETLDFNRYPDPSCAKLRDAFALRLGVRPAQVLLGNGSDELIQMIIMAFGGQGGQVLIPLPTFSMYRNIALSLGENVTSVPLDSSFDLDLPAMLKEKGARRSITFLSYPNNPTGNCFSEAAISEILEKSQGIVVVDEAYFDYSKKSFISRLKDYPNLIILRTLSKVGLASLRLGALIASEKITDIVNRVRLPYNIGSMQQAVALAALESGSDIEKGVGLIIKERARMCELLSDIEGIEIFRSDSNFILFRALDADLTFNALVKRGVLIRNLNSDGALKNCLRVTIGSAEENDSFINALRN